MIKFSKTILVSLFVLSVFIPKENAFTDELEENSNNEPQEFVLDLEKGINLALRAGKTLNAALSAVDQSLSNIDLAKADFNLIVIPRADAGLIGGGKAGEGMTIGGGIDISKKFSNGTFVTVTPSMMKAADNYQSNVRMLVSQPLLRGFGKEYTLGGVFGAKYANRTAIRNLYQAKIQLILQTIDLLYSISQQEHLVILNEDSLDRIKKFYVAAKLKQKIGIGDTLNVYRAEIELKNAEDTLHQSLDTLQEAKENLRDLLGMPLDYPFTVNVPIEYNAEDINYETAVEIALSNRIEIDLAEDQSCENRRLERIAKKNLKPELNLVVDYTSFGFGEALTGAWTAKRENKWGVGFTTSTDFNNLAAKIAHEQSINAVNDADTFIDQTKENIALEVKRGVRYLKRAKQRIELQKEQIHNATKEYKFANLKFEHGYASNFDLIQAENNLKTAQGALLTAVVDHKVGEYRFLATLGTLADKPAVCP